MARKTIKKEVRRRIYDARRLIEKLRPTDISFINSYEGDYSDFVEPKYTAQDICFTSKGDTVYAICPAWPEKTVHIKSLGEKALDDLDVVSVSMLSIDDDLKWEQRRDGLAVVFPDKKPCKYAYVVKIQVSGE